MISFLERLRDNPKVSAFDEASTKQAIVLPLLQKLEWNTTDIDEVTPEYSIENGRVDYSLRIRNEDEVFLEVKKPGEDLERHQKQLLDYSFHQGVDLAILTNGITWWFYLPMKKGDWSTRKFYTIDIIQQETKDISQKFDELLSKTKVQAGEALQYAESIYKGKLKTKKLEKTLPEAWNKLVSEPDDLLLELISETTEKLCGFEPELDDVKKFVRRHKDHFLLSPIPTRKQPADDKGKVIIDLKPPIPGEVIPVQTLVSLIVKSLKKHGGRARKTQIEKDIFEMCKEEFQKEVYQQPVANGVPRWKHNIAWAKERGKQDGLIQRPSVSGRGYWQLTEKAMKN